MAKKFLKKVDWPTKIVELLVVIVGVTIAFSLNNWNESRKTRQQEATYLAAMGDELKRDIEDLDSLIYNDSISEIAFIKLARLDENNLISPDSLTWAFTLLSTLNSFEKHNVTFESLKSSGKLDLIRDIQLRLKVLSYYHNNYAQILEIERYYRNSFDNKIIPSLLDDLNLAGDQQDRSFLFTRRFKNMVLLHLAFLQQKIRAYQNCLESAEELKKNISQEQE